MGIGERNLDKSVGGKTGKSKQQSQVKSGTSCLIRLYWLFLTANLFTHGIVEFSPLILNIYNPLAIASGPDIKS